MTQLVPLCLLSVLGAACAPDEPLLVSEDTAELGDRGKTLIQPGTDQILLAVTDDNFAVYQEGHAIFATKLRRGAARSFVGEVPATNIAQVLQVGKVVFVWTDPQRDLPGLGVSPLLLWTAREGTQLLSAQSAVRLVATAASSDRRQVVFTTHVTDDGLRGDLVHAFTGDALHPTDPARRHPAELSVGAVPAARELRPRSRARGPGRRVLRRHRHDGDAVEVGRHHEARSAREHRDALVVRA